MVGKDELSRDGSQPMSKILVIDDDESLGSTFKAALGHFGYEVTVAENGEEGIRLAREWLPDVILCDVNMPGMDGKAVLQAMRADPHLANRQIVLMTGDQIQNSLREGMNLGADDYLSKPFAINQLRTCVETRLRRAQIYRRLEDGVLRRHADLFGVTLPHEFMTPLNGILGLAEILKEDIDKIPLEESRQLLANIESCAQRLHRTLMNYIKLATVEADSEKSAVPAELGFERSIPIITAVAQEMAEKAHRPRDLALNLDPISILCREDDLRFIVDHLVGNAFGFSTSGSPVTVGFKLDQGSPTLIVQDLGRGMSADQIEQIGLFMQFDRKRFEQQGLGIGLALVKRLLQRNRGRFTFESAPGRGTIVRIAFHTEN